MTKHKADCLTANKSDTVRRLIDIGSYTKGVAYCETDTETAIDGGSGIERVIRLIFCKKSYIIKESKRRALQYVGGDLCEVQRQ